MLIKSLQAAAGNVAPTDPDFEYVTMLLHGDGTNGAQNNTFLDASTNNFTITRNGNATQGSFSPYGDLWSAYFDGTTGLNDTGAGLIGTTTSTFSVEGWVCLTAAPAGSAQHGSLVGLNANFTTTTNYLSFGPDTGQKLRLFWYDGSDKSCYGSTTLTIGVWYHIALVVNSNAISMYVNGVSESLTGTTTLTNRSGTSGQFNIGKNGQTQFKGYASNIRISDNARTITVPTAPYTSDANTLVLACNQNRFASPAQGTSAITWESISGSVTNFAPFAPTAAYSTATNGGSGYFDGAGDYLTAPDNTALEMGSSDFTMEAWLYPNDSGWQTILTKSADSATAEFQFYAYNNAVNFFGSAGSTWNVGFYTGAVLVPKAWNHVAVTRSGSSWTIWVNGVSQATATASFTISNNTSAVAIGAFTNSVYYANGYLTDVRIVKGTAVYTAAFTPPTAPLTAITNTSLLLNFTNGAIFDNSMKNDLETVGNAQISTSVKKFGTGSIYVDGTGDWLFARSSPNISLSGNFTIEGWVYQVSNGTSATLLCIGDSDVTGGIALYLDTTSSPTGPRLSLLYNSAILNGSTAAAINTWHHIAAVRSGSTITLFLNGVSQGTVSASTTFTGNLLVGATLFAGTTYPANNYIDDLRITKGVARYTANFTPPTAAFPNN